VSLRIGITGNIGSGKTTVCQIFATLGIPIYYADPAARRLMETDRTLIRAITQLLGPRAYNPDGSLDRAYVARQIFGNERLLQNLNRLVHPAVGQDGLRWHRAQSGVPYTLYEAALIYESGGDRAMDAVIVVSAPEAIRLRRVMERDGVSEADVRARMARQWPEARKVARADFVIDNDGDHALIPQVLAIHRALQERSENGSQV
jgi:dephospho-CoA kinase